MMRDSPTQRVQQLAHDLELKVRLAADALTRPRRHLAAKALQSGERLFLLAHERQGEQGEAGGYATTGISSASRSLSGYQRLKMAPSSPLSVFTRVCSHKCAPSLDHCICCFLGRVPWGCG
jgi:hypothetical protein